MDTWRRMKTSGRTLTQVKLQCRCKLRGLLLFVSLAAVVSCWLSTANRNKWSLQIRFCLDSQRGVVFIGFLERLSADQQSLVQHYTLVLMPIAVVVDRRGNWASRSLFYTKKHKMIQEWGIGSEKDRRGMIMGWECPYIKAKMEWKCPLLFIINYHPQLRKDCQLI